MTDIKEVYKVKQELSKRRDVSELKRMIESGPADVKVYDDDVMGRMLRVDDKSDGMKDNIEKSILSWSEIDIGFPASMLYNMFLFGPNTCMIKV